MVGDLRVQFRFEMNRMEFRLSRKVLNVARFSSLDCLVPRVVLVT